MFGTIEKGKEVKPPSDGVDAGWHFSNDETAADEKSGDYEDVAVIRSNKMQVCLVTNKIPLFKIKHPNISVHDSPASYIEENDLIITYRPILTSLHGTNAKWFQTE